MGFDTVDVLAGRFNIKLKRSRFNALAGKGTAGGENILLVKPLTYMNLSGNAVSGLAGYYKVPPENIIVIYDDTDMDVGRIRVRKQGSAGGHNGMKSIIACLGTEKFPRIRIGIGKRGENEDMVDFVLGKFGKNERKIIDEAIERAADAAEDIVKNGADHAMNEFN